MQGEYSKYNFNYSVIINEPQLLAEHCLSNMIIKGAYIRNENNEKTVPEKRCCTNVKWNLGFDKI